MYLIIYDITENSLRTKVSNLLIQEGYERLQFSVFTGYFNPQKNKVWQQLTKWMATSDNSIICIKIRSKNFLSMQILGRFTIDLNDLAGNKITKII
ncbi:CRISPR-associated endonuclease Cas2 [Flavivirga jejuensis]|uniref:CRISPR-associated endoribonuclease Cas2 n=1 Tax=Flavivirga jejuensis TaxID=870487 RepID=A0ABT8WV33_9FLAO|nr:CRISPR-associated endonuclease Cas2 [Flavivirga jejuensis]MDO5976949.1 CRISPR-associated endonuclease Cas2 [Flavivirga jejuensis]